MHEKLPNFTLVENMNTRQFFSFSFCELSYRPLEFNSWKKNRQHFTNKKIWNKGDEVSNSANSLFGWGFRCLCRPRCLSSLFPCWCHVYSSFHLTKQFSLPWVPRFLSEGCSNLQIIWPLKVCMLWSHSLSTELILSEGIDHHTGDNDLYTTLYEQCLGFWTSHWILHTQGLSDGAYGLSSLTGESNRPTVRSRLHSTCRQHFLFNYPERWSLSVGFQPTTLSLILLAVALAKKNAIKLLEKLQLVIKKPGKYLIFFDQLPQSKSLVDRRRDY